MGRLHAGVMEKSAHAMLSISQDPVYVLLMINLLLLIAGSLMDGVSIFFIFTPILIRSLSTFIGLHVVRVVMASTCPSGQSPHLSH